MQVVFISFFFFSFENFQIKSEVFLEDLNNVLNAGDVPNIYAPDELDTIYSTMKPIVQDQGLQPTKVNLFMSYTKRVRSNIHMVICMRFVKCLVLRTVLERFWFV